ALFRQPGHLIGVGVLPVRAAGPHHALQRAGLALREEPALAVVAFQQLRGEWGQDGAVDRHEGRPAHGLVELAGRPQLDLRLAGRQALADVAAPSREAVTPRGHDVLALADVGPAPRA